jgi:pyrroloquinoline quinone biosynthesis protein D
MPPLPDNFRPCLAPHARRRADPIDGEPLLLYPEGALRLDETTAALLDLCDGARTVSEIAALLAEQYEAPVDEIAADIAECLSGLAAEGLILSAP